MAKIKKILLTILLVFSLVFAVLCIIQLVDQAINGKIYAKIDTFFTELKVASKDNICIRNSNYLMDINKKNSKSDKYKLLPNTFYDSTILSCKTLIKNRNKIKIPQDIPKQKRIAIQDYMYYSNKVINFYSSELLPRFKICKGNNSCLFDLDNARPRVNSLEMGFDALRMSLSYIKAKERLSVKNILYGFAIENIISYQAEKMEKKYNISMSKN